MWGALWKLRYVHEAHNLMYHFIRFFLRPQCMFRHFCFAGDFVQCCSFPFFRIVKTVPGLGAGHSRQIPTNQGHTGRKKYLV